MLNITIAIFFIGIISISYEQGIFTACIFMGLLILLFFNREQRYITSVLLAFLIGFSIFMIANNFLEATSFTKEIKIVLNRLSLIFIILSLVVHSLIFPRKIVWYNNKPNWTEPIVLPFHKINIFWFWLIGIIVNAIVYLVFIVQKDLETLQTLFWFCIGFSLINAIFEEVIWRGLMLSTLVKITSPGYVVFITSVGFGLLHLAIGFSMGLSLLIAVAGVFYALITLKTNSIYPSMVFHFVVNVGMVYSGFII
ncbi:CPBP family intramembrane metalloprotease [Ureibacillus chungkukjangi]|uniref:CPBP family intramembrane glutamic endopeptidase n=1 Tax=Ureibacillus chungkukjangi TaxID=1202712 RepID=UPI00384E6D92